MNWTIIVHAIFGAAVVAAVATLAATHTITGTEAITFISSVSTFILGVGATVIGANSSTPTVSPPTTSSAMPPKTP